MDGNKDEALRCIRLAEEAIVSGNKERALKFIKIARRLNQDLPVDELLAMCVKLDSQSTGSPSKGDDVGRIEEEQGFMRSDGSLNGERSYTQEHVQLIRQIKGKNDYYAILGVEKTCSVEEIRKAYRKLSLKVHPDKNKAPGSEEAFKKVSKAFKCLSDDDSRRQYDQVGLVGEFGFNQQHNVTRRRRRTTDHDFFDDEFDPDEIFRAFFGQPDVFGRTRHVYRTREMGTQQRAEFQGGGLNIMLILQLLPLLIIFLLAYLPYSEPEYSLRKNPSYQIPKTTENYEVEFYVKSEAFDTDYPHGSPARADIEDNIIRDYKIMLRRYCQVEIQRRSWNRNLPIPHCEKLQNLGIA